MTRRGEERRCTRSCEQEWSGRCRKGQRKSVHLKLSLEAVVVVVVQRRVSFSVVLLGLVELSKVFELDRAEVERSEGQRTAR
jgi:hypothetical protein